MTTPAIITEIETLAADKSAAGRFHAARINQELKFKTECHYALGIVKNSEQLQRAIPETVLGCIQDVALLGLSLNPEQKLAYLIPRKIKNVGTVATLYTSWRGLTVAAEKWGGLRDMDAQVVYANEKCHISFGTEPTVQHEVILNAKARGEKIGAYCIAYMTSGHRKVEYVDAEQIARIRKASESQGSSYSPWNTFEEEMWRKSAVRRAAKHWQGTPELQSSLGVQAKYEGMGTALLEADTAAGEVELLTDEQCLTLHAKLSDNGCDANKVLGRVARVMGVHKTNEIAAHRYGEALQWVDKAIAAKQGDKHA